VEAVRDAGDTAAETLLTKAGRERLEYGRPFGHLDRGNLRAIKGDIDRLHGKASEAVAGSAPGLDPDASSLRAAEKTGLLQEGIPLKSSRVIVDEIECRLGTGANIGRRFYRSRPGLALSSVQHPKLPATAIDTPLVFSGSVFSIEAGTLVHCALFARRLFERLPLAIVTLRKSEAMRPVGRDELPTGRLISVDGCEPKTALVRINTQRQEPQSR
jgi:hypothetical protein